ncbi:MAG: archaetidylserine decarboxylase [Coxiella-like endosymbiont]|uniref:archaetidylserine decarboxylase n=1 Tax=Coxiella-like endosymbiont TaxID=1592897 RepID=UPI00215B4CC3|nr:archaetidylserine decarboxylase [Coxiella-like endosymbiont]UVE59439.1 archaetidylserine decarboxylase [Coxiella-like endosymbiont]
MVRLCKYLLQYRLSRIVGWLADRQWGLLTRWAIKFFIRYYRVDMREAEYSNIHYYSSFNSFFTRYLKTNLRPLSEDSNAIISPVDGIIGEVGQLTGGQVIQAKNRFYTVVDLLGGDENHALLFQDGYFFTTYLAPRNYHRIHAPIDGQLKAMIHIPGCLFSVNTISVRTVPHLFARNERVVCLFETKAGLMAVVMVGAMLVGSISTVWHGAVTPTAKNSISIWKYTEEKITLTLGEELGHFKMGSTVILLFPNHSIAWEMRRQTGDTLCYGEKIGILYEMQK